MSRRQEGGGKGIERGLTKAAELLARLEASLEPPVRAALEAVLRLAEEDGRVLYLVGGGVRDLLLGRGQVDVDLVGEGEMLSLAQKAGRRLTARCLAHGTFGTVTVKAEDFRLDLAMARAETYWRPGALPRVRPASIGEDLARRDFSINAMALALGGPERGDLLDPFNGRGDIARRLVRVLHDGSFTDDATRILRAVRYETRLSFRIEGETLALLKRDLSYLDTISGARLRQEFLRLLAEEEPEKRLRRCQELEVLAVIHQALRFDEELAAACRRARQACPERSRREGAPGPELYLALLGTHLSPAEGAAVARRLALSRRQRQALEGAAELAGLLPWLARPDLRPSQVVERLGPFPQIAVRAWALLASQPLARERLGRYLLEWRYVKPRLDGRALESLGLAPGSLMGEVLRMLKEARLDRRTGSREEEVELVQRALRDRGER